MQPALRYLRRAFEPNLLLLALTFGAALTLAAKAGLLGLPLAAVLLPWFCKYLFVVVDRVAHGVDEAPVLSLDMVSPLSDWRGIGQAAIIIFVWIVTGALETWIDAGGVTLLRTALLLALPASIAVLAIDGNPLKAVNPLALWRVAVGLGGWYWLVIGAALAAGLIASWVTAAVGWLLLQFSLVLALLLALASLLGSALFERRAELGIDAWYSPERNAERAAKATHLEHDKFIDEVYALARNRSHDNAWRAIERRLAEHQHADSEYDWLLEGLQRLEDPRHLQQLRRRYVERLVTARRTADGLKIVERIWRVAPEFRPHSAAATLTLAHTAIDAGMARVARVLLADFAERFPGHPSGPLAAQLLAKVARS